MKANQWMSFPVKNQISTQAIEAIKEINPYDNPGPVPGAAEYVEGILSARRLIVPILPAQLLFDLETQTERKDAKIISLEKEASMTGISADSVGKMIGAEPGEAERADTTGEEPRIKGALQSEGHLYILTDFIELKSDGEKYA